MSLKNSNRSIVLVALAAACAANAPDETKADSSISPIKTVTAHTRRDDRGASSAAAQSDLIDELLGIGGTKSTQEALSPSRTDSVTLIQPAARQRQTTAQPATDKTDSSAPPIKTAAMHTRRDDRGASSAAAQSDLIDELLGIAGTKPTQEALSPNRTDSVTLIQRVARQPQTAVQSSTAKSGSQSGNGSLGAMFGRLIRIDVDTNTVDIQFEGSRQTTVGSKFSVEHDYAFTTEYLGKIEVVYLAGGNRAIAKPVDKTDITKMGKGDRVGGRIVPNPKETSAGGSTQAAAGGTSPHAGAADAGAPRGQKRPCPAPACVKPRAGKLPQPPPDAAVPYSPDKECVLEEPAPAPEKTQPTLKLGPPVAGNHAGRAPRDKWNGPLARSWGIGRHRNSPATVSVTCHSPTPTTLPWRSRSLWCAVQPKPAASPSPASLPASVSFESE